MASSPHLPVALLMFAVTLLVASFAEGQVYLSKLPNTMLVVTASLPSGGPFTDQGIQTAQDSILVSWKVNTTAPPVDAEKVQIKLCYAIESQKERLWRRTSDDLAKDKTCQFVVTSANYSFAGASVNVSLPNSVPRGKYFVRAYALDASGLPLGYGQSSFDKIANVFSVVPITGRSSSMNAAAAILSILSVTCLFGFFVLECLVLKRKKRV